MFGFFRRKKNKDKAEEVPTAEAQKHKELEKTLEEELAKEKKRAEKKKEKGPNWISLLVMLVSLGAAIFFWLYGRLADFGMAGLKPEIDFSTITSSDTEPDSSPKPQKLRTNPDGLIIFEKED